MHSTDDRLRSKVPRSASFPVAAPVAAPLTALTASGRGGGDDVSPATGESDAGAGTTGGS